jgi:hypothetical protein
MKLKKEVEQYRIKTKEGVMGTPPGCTRGSFVVPYQSNTIFVICDDGELTGWEHVSVSLRNRCPNWNEMCFIKNLFWSEDDTVVQIHPPKSDYVNIHEYCLHLWRKIGNDFEMPNKVMV